MGVLVIHKRYCNDVFRRCARVQGGTRAHFSWGYSSSKIPAAPMPPPMHMVTMAYLPPLSRR